MLSIALLGSLTIFSHDAIKEKMDEMGKVYKVLIAFLDEAKILHQKELELVDKANAEVGAKLFIVSAGVSYDPKILESFLREKLNS